MVKISRRKEEFYCHECDKYFLTFLRTNMTGQYTIECPECKHHHFRKIDKGLVTGDRCNHLAGQLDILIGMGSTVRNTPWHNDPAYRRSQMGVV